MYDWFNRHLRLGYSEVPRGTAVRPVERHRGERVGCGASEAARRRGTRACAPDVADARMRQPRWQRSRRATPRRARRFTRRGRRRVLACCSAARSRRVTTCGSRSAPQTDRQWHHHHRSASTGIERRGASGAAVVARTRDGYRGLDIAGRQGVDARRSGAASSPRRAVAGGRLRRARDRRARAGRVAERRQVTFDPVRLASERAHAGFTFGYNLPLPAERVQDVLTAIRFARNRVGASGRVLLLGLGTRGRVGCWCAGAGTALMSIAPCSISRASGSPRWTGSTRRIFCPAQRSTVTCPRCWRCRHPRELWFREQDGRWTCYAAPSGIVTGAITGRQDAAAQLDDRGSPGPALGRWHRVGACVDSASGPASTVITARQQFVHLVHHPVHLLDRQIERLAARHVDAGVLQQLDRILRPARGDERPIALDRARLPRQHLLGQRRRRGERRGVLVHVERIVEVRDELPLVRDVVVDHADARRRARSSVA